MKSPTPNEVVELAVIGGNSTACTETDGTPRFIWLARIGADRRTAVTFSLSPGKAHDASKGRRLLKNLGRTSRPVHLLMDCVNEGNETRQLALDLGFIPVFPPIKTRIDPCGCDCELYKRSNEVERLFRRLKCYRRTFSRFKKLVVMFIDFLNFEVIADGHRNLC